MRPQRDAAERIIAPFHDPAWSAEYPITAPGAEVTQTWCWLTLQWPGGELAATHALADAPARFTATVVCCCAPAGSRLDCTIGTVVVSAIATGIRQELSVPARGGQVSLHITPPGAGGPWLASWSWTGVVDQSLRLALDQAHDSPDPAWPGLIDPQADWSSPRCPVSGVRLAAHGVGCRSGCGRATRRTRALSAGRRGRR